LDEVVMAKLGSTAINLGIGAVVLVLVYALWANRGTLSLKLNQMLTMPPGSKGVFGAGNARGTVSGQPDPNITGDVPAPSVSNVPIGPPDPSWW
jgi:hypothetical protein